MVREWTKFLALNEWCMVHSPTGLFVMLVGRIGRLDGRIREQKLGLLS